MSDERLSHIEGIYGTHSNGRPNGLVIKFGPPMNVGMGFDDYIGLSFGAGPSRSGGDNSGSEGGNEGSGNDDDGDDNHGGSHGHHHCHCCCHHGGAGGGHHNTDNSSGTNHHNSLHEYEHNTYNGPTNITKIYGGHHTWSSNDSNPTTTGAINNTPRILTHTPTGGYSHHGYGNNIQRVNLGRIDLGRLSNFPNFVI
ncbi:hypothetical protein H4219_004690 [Mycoemilia scoparia]|uniref:Uncharacterized protein n=1 Tax=Mycoemilia scoparia TaxID=417184 RepID=A0A9W8DQY1_9FUNG|nr:hypothetical protein H4219_004690 [Mycoemilia scoparia]